MNSVVESRVRRDRDWLPVFAFICGALTGAALATLVAPASGRDTRRRLMAEARKGRSRVARSDYVQRLEAQLETWSAQIDALAARSSDLGTEAARGVQEQLADVRTRIRSAHVRLERLRAAGGSAWRQLANGADRAWQELRAAVERAASELR